MARMIECPQCGEADNLRGSETLEGIRITCGECGQSWLRDEQPERCVTCGGSDLVKRPHALTQYSRGTQLSIVGIAETSCVPTAMLRWSSGPRAGPCQRTTGRAPPRSVTTMTTGRDP